MDDGPISDYAANLLYKQFDVDTVKTFHPNFKQSLVDLHVERFHNMLGKYLPRADQDLLREKLLCLGGIISGPSAIEAFTACAPNNALYITVPEIHGVDILEFFTDRSYSTTTSRSNNDLGLSATQSPFRPAEDFKPSKTTDDKVYIAGICRLERDSRVVEIILARSHPLEVILNSTSTLMMTFITASEMIMCYPRLTLVDHKALDTTRKPNENIKLKCAYFEYDYIQINPLLTLYDLLDPSRDLTVLPRRIGDDLCLVIPLPPLPVPDVLMLGHHSMFKAHSWQLLIPPNTSHRVVTDFFFTRRLRQTYLLAPGIKQQLSAGLVKEWNLDCLTAPENFIITPPECDKHSVDELSKIYNKVFNKHSPWRRVVASLSAGGVGTW
ncbi:hypothetical protein VNI00_011192 [Paramarasmius palmivorus]|uniref:Uncharacterized protein n=1 Tax=Paramarasmius palmivorus TaxID=297713 RepID=A0AAW0BAL2_9AGAR